MVATSSVVAPLDFVADTSVLFAPEDIPFNLVTALAGINPAALAVASGIVVEPVTVVPPFLVPVHVSVLVSAA